MGYGSKSNKILKVDVTGEVNSRFNNVNSQLAEKAQEIKDISLLLSNYPRLSGESDDSYRILRAVEDLKTKGGGTLNLNESTLFIQNLTKIQDLNNFKLYSTNCVITVNGTLNTNYLIEFYNCKNGIVEGLQVINDTASRTGRPFRVNQCENIELIQCYVEGSLDHGFTTMGDTTINITYRNCKAKNIGWHCFAHDDSPDGTYNFPLGNIKYVECTAENSGYDFANPNVRKSDGMAFDVHNNKYPVWIEKCVMINCVQMGKNSSGQGGDAYWINNKFTQDDSVDYSLSTPPIIQLGNPNGQCSYFLNNVVEVSIQKSMTLFINYGNAKIKDNVFKTNNSTIAISILQLKASKSCVCEHNKFYGFNINGSASGSVVYVTENVGEVIFNNNYLENITLSASGRGMVTTYYNSVYKVLNKLSFDNNVINNIQGGGTGNYYVILDDGLDRLSIKGNDFKNVSSYLVKPISGGTATKYEYRNNLGLDGDNVISA